MTKNGTKGISATLATATCSLLGTGTVQPVCAEELERWDFDTAFLYYGENENRVQDASVNILAIRDFLDDRKLSLGLTIDSLTGATPNGALAQPVPQTFTRPSGHGTYTTGPAGIPLDDTFLDTRVALSGTWTQPVGRLNTLSIGGTFSTEYDYTHFGLNARFARDFNQRNTTLSGGLAIAHDEIDPVGGTPNELTPMRDATDDDSGVGDDEARRGALSKDVLDFVVGVTQVLSRNTIVQLNYSYSDSSGYLTDPYKVVSVVDPLTGLAVPRVPPPGVDGPDHVYLYENRPDSRSKHSLYAQAKHNLGGKVLDVSYRYMTDDWDIDSHTIDARLRWPLGARAYLEPHLRYYTQAEANFYTASLVDGAPVPAYASNDYRLGRFDAITAGLKYGWQTRGGKDMSVRLELYQQRGEVPGEMLVGDQSASWVFPDLDALIAQFSFRF
jgi:hypothetical protein